MQKILSLLVSGLSIPLLTAATQNEKPNIILIMADQMRFDCMGASGNKFVITPNLDRLAEAGSIFSNAYSSAPSSTPARAGLLTGNSPWKHGMLGYGKQAEHYPHEMPRMLHDAGFYAFGIGKMHFNPQANLHGFDCVLFDESGRKEDPYYISDYHKWFALQMPGKDPDASGLDWNDHRGGIYPYAEKLHPTHWIGQQAVDFIENYKNNSPFFLKVSFERPHSPYDPPQRFLDMYKDRQISKRWIGDWSDSLRVRPETATAAYGDFGEQNADSTRRYYYATLSFVDEQIGRVINALKEKDMYDNSVIVFVADHGDMLGDHYHWRKAYAYEGSSHIPLIVKLPGKQLQAVRNIRQVVELRDILPTFLQEAGVSQPEDMDGKSLIPLIKGAGTKWRDWIDLEHTMVYDENNYWAALTDGNMKYIWFFPTGREQLFDLEQDPHEINELSQKPAYAEKLRIWRNRMTQHLSERGEPFVKDGKLQIFQNPMLYGPNYPAKVSEKQKSPTLEL